jgi:hypothetical protein
MISSWTVTNINFHLLNLTLPQDSLYLQGSAQDLWTVEVFVNILQYKFQNQVTVIYQSLFYHENSSLNHSHYFPVL